MFCKEQVAQLRCVAPEMQALGADLVMVRNGTPEQAGWFTEEYGLTFPAFTDPSLGLYRAVRAHRGILTILHPRAITNMVRSFRRGYRQTRTQGLRTQQ